MVLPMGRRDIADYLGLTLETVSRGLSALRDEGILSFIGQTGRKIALQDRCKLARYAMSTEPTSNPERTIWSVTDLRSDSQRDGKRFTPLPTPSRPRTRR